jgi:hypothetical protein
MNPRLMKNAPTDLRLQPPLVRELNGGPECATPANGSLRGDPRLVHLIRLLARQAAEDYLDDVFGRGGHDRK